MNKRSAVILLSGGLDSATTLAIAGDLGFTACHAISFHYGQRHHVELQCAKKLGEQYAVASHQQIDIDLRAIGGSALTSPIPVPKDRNPKQMNSDIPVTYVPARNTIFLAYALARAEVLDCQDIFIGVNSVDYSGYPDCRPEYIAAFETLANLATKAGVLGHKLTVHTPLINLTKVDIIKRGLSLGVDYALTHSCYDPSNRGQPCRRCDACLLRMQAFEKLGMTDPVLN